MAPYPFTTLMPNLGVMAAGGWDDKAVLADLPGLIEGGCMLGSCLVASMVMLHGDAWQLLCCHACSALSGAGQPDDSPGCCCPDVQFAASVGV